MSRIRLDFSLYGVKADAFLMLFNKTQLLVGKTISKPAMVMILAKAFSSLSEEQQLKIVDQVLNSLKATSQLNEIFEWSRDEGVVKERVLPIVDSSPTSLEFKSVNDNYI